MILLKKYINNIFGIFGLQITRVNSQAPIKTIDVGFNCHSDDLSFDMVSNKSISPRYLSYLIDGKTILANVSPENGRALPIHSYGVGGNHPFLIATKIAQNYFNSSRYECMYNILNNYYSFVSPHSAGELAGVSRRSKLFKYPSWGLVMPWDIYSPEEQMIRVKKFVLTENYFFDRGTSIANGWAWVGPADEKKCQIETRRLYNLLKSISKDGYKRHDGFDGDIRAILLINDDDEWVWQSTGGQHRAAVLSGIGYESIPIRIHHIIRRQDFAYWPNVVNKIYDSNDAITVFDNIFHGHYDHITAGWNNYLETHGNTGN